jgi:hypothetical protein
MKHAIIVGAQRSGSTYLFRLLDEHPEIAMAYPPRPEPKVFLDDAILERGAEWYDATFFGHADERTKLHGEKSTTYIERPDAGRRIRTVLPDAQILIILRDPVARAISNYRFSVDNGLEALPLDQALAKERERAGEASATSTNPYAYRQRGHYAEYVGEYLELFDPAQINIMVFEELVGNAQRLAELYRWLGVDESVTPPSLEKVVNRSGQSGEPVDPEILRDLADGYEESVTHLEQMLGRSLQLWRERWAAL